MDPFLVLALGLIVLGSVSVVYVIRASNQPPLPGPGLLEYLPGGLVFPMFWDSRKATEVLDVLAETYGDVFQLWLGPRRVVMTSVPDDLVQMSSNSAKFQRPDRIPAVFKQLAPGGLFTLRGKSHRDLKRELTKTFNPGMLTSEKFQDHLMDAIAELCDFIQLVADERHPKPSSVIDVSKLLVITTIRVITNVALGIDMDREDRLQFADIVNTMADELMKEMIYPFRDVLAHFGARNTLVQNRIKIHEVARKVIDMRKEQADECRSENEEPHFMDSSFSNENDNEETMVSIVTEIVLAGSHTTAQTIAWSIYETCCFPNAMLKIEKELAAYGKNRSPGVPFSIKDLESLPYLTAVWKETCRLHTIGPVIGRAATDDVSLRGSGIKLPKGSEIHGHFRRTQRHSQIWADPNLFRPERWISSQKPSQQVSKGAFMPFGIGQLSCPGRFLADCEGPLILAELHRRFKFILACDADELQTVSCFVDTPKYINEEMKVEMGVPVHVMIR